MTPVRRRLMFPPNAVPDTGINLKPKPVFTLVAAPSPPPVKLTPFPVYEKKSEQIVRAVCRIFKITRADLTGPDRQHYFSRARHVAMALCAKLSRDSTSQIGRMLDRDHTTVLHGIHKMESHLLAIRSNELQPVSIDDWVFAMRAQLKEPEADSYVEYRKEKERARKRALRIRRRLERAQSLEAAE